MAHHRNSDFAGLIFKRLGAIHPAVLDTRNDSRLMTRTFLRSTGEVYLRVVCLTVMYDIVRSNDAADGGRVERELQLPDHGTLRDPTQDAPRRGRHSIQVNRLSTTSQIRVQPLERLRSNPK